VHTYPLHYFPYPPLYLLAFFLLLALVFLVLRVGVIGFAFERLGLSRRLAFGTLLAALLGSWVNIPVAQLPAQRVVEPMVVPLFGMQYVIPLVAERGSTVIAINVGGALIPLLLCVRLLLRYGTTRRGLAVLAVATLITHALAQPVPGVGIALPPLLPPLIIAAAALLLDPRDAPRTAFIAGTLGTLIGADLLNLGRLQDLGAPVASIGGAGTFDAVFMNGILAVLLAGLPGWRWRRRDPRAIPDA
jgi:uncharacterized membrane protein